MYVDRPARVLHTKIESSMYKRRRTAMPTQPTTPQFSAEAVAASRFAALGPSLFYQAPPAIPMILAK